MSKIWSATFHTAAAIGLILIQIWTQATGKLQDTLKCFKIRISFVKGVFHNGRNKLRANSRKPWLVSQKM